MKSLAERILCESPKGNVIRFFRRDVYQNGIRRTKFDSVNLPEGRLAIDELTLKTFVMCMIEAQSIPPLALEVLTTQPEVLLALNFDLACPDMGAVPFPTEGAYNWIRVSAPGTTGEFTGTGMLMLTSFTQKYLKKWESAFVNLSGFLDDRSSSTGLFPHPVVITQSLTNVVQSIVENPYDGIRKKIFVEAKMQELVLYTLAYKNNRKTVPGLTEADMRRVKEAYSYIHHHFLERITLPLLARHVGLNSFKLKRGFKFLYGSGVITFARKERMAYAHALIENTNRAIQDIAYEVGFKNLPNFTSAFKRIYGYPPARLRRRN